MKKVIKLSEAKNLLETILKDYLLETSDFENENGDLDWDGDGKNIGIEKNALLKDFRDYIDSFSEIL